MTPSCLFVSLAHFKYHPTPRGVETPSCSCPESPPASPSPLKVRRGRCATVGLCKLCTNLEGRRKAASSSVALQLERKMSTLGGNTEIWSDRRGLKGGQGRADVHCLAIKQAGTAGWAESGDSCTLPPNTPK